jgi:hypothetical protein
VGFLAFLFVGGRAPGPIWPVSPLLKNPLTSGSSGRCLASRRLLGRRASAAPPPLAAQPHRWKDLEGVSVI